MRMGTPYILLRIFIVKPVVVSCGCVWWTSELYSTNQVRFPRYTPSCIVGDYPRAPTIPSTIKPKREQNNLQSHQHHCKSTSHSVSSIFPAKLGTASIAMRSRPPPVTYSPRSTIPQTAFENLALPSILSIKNAALRSTGGAAIRASHSRFSRCASKSTWKQRTMYIDATPSSSSTSRIITRYMDG